MISLTDIQQLPNYQQALELFDTIYQGERSCVPEGLKTRRELIQQELTPKEEPVALWIHGEGIEALFEVSRCRLTPQLSVMARTRLYRQGVRPLGMVLRIQGSARYFAAKDTEPLSLKKLSREEYQQWRRGVRELLKQQKQEISEKERVILTLMLHLLDRFPPLSTSIFELELTEGMTAVEQAKQAADKRKDHRHRLTDVTEADHRAFLLLSRWVAVEQSELLNVVSKARFNEYLKLSLITKFSTDDSDYYKLGEKGKEFVKEHLSFIRQDELVETAIQAFQQNQQETVILNLQTTNSLPDSEIIYLAILQPNGCLLYENYFKPSRQIFKPILAQTDLTHEVLDRAALWKEEWLKIQACLAGKQILTDRGTFVLEKLLNNLRRYELISNTPFNVMDVGDYFKRQMGVDRLSDVYQRAFQLASPTEVENGRYQTFLLAQLIHPTWDLTKKQDLIEALFQQYCESTVVDTVSNRQVAGWKWIQQLFHFFQSPNTFRALSQSECSVLDQQLNRALQLVKSKKH